nr:LamG domain-containing protein [Streptomyces sp. NBC_00995]
MSKTRRGGRWRTVGLLAAAALSVTLLPGPVEPAAAATGDAPVELTEAQQALVDAKAQGDRVEVTGERDEHRTVYANPDGFTFTLAQSIVPVRVKKAGGAWQKPDPALEFRADGSVGPRAAAVEMTFSGGGDQALVKIADHGRSLELGWRASLPVPELDGASALYREVLPDVDLKLTATAESFQQVLVVRTAEAAADPELKKLTFALDAKRLKVVKGPAGNLTALDDEGRTVFRAPPARMWDSAGSSADVPLASPVRSAAGLPAAAAAVRRDEAETGPSGSGLEPGQGDNVARMKVQLAAGALSVVPDTDMLARTDTSAFPLFIDPNVTWGESERTLLRSDGYESYGWSNGDDNVGKGVGKCGTWNGYYCGPGYTQRLYFEFSPANLKGKNILDATFQLTEPWAFQCSPRWVDLARTNNISSSTTWSSKPTYLDLMVDRYVSAGRGSACDPDQPDAPIIFNDAADESNENLTPTVRSFAAGKFSRLTLMLMAHDEGDTAAWKRFRNDAVLVVTYVGLAATPKDVGLVAGSGRVCSTSSSAPSTVSDPTPLVTGKPVTAAGGESGASLRIRWRTEKLSAGTWVTATSDIDSPTSGYVGSGATQNRSLATLSEGVTYRLKALTLSHDEAGTNRLNSGYSSPCYFKIDPTAPKAPLVTPAAGSAYSLCGAVCLPGGGPNIKGSFHFAPASGDSNVAYQYKQSTSTSWSAEIAGATVDRDIVPQASGTYLLEVRAKDTVGRWGASQVISFLVKEGEGPVGRWHFDEATGTAVDSSSTVAANQENATLSAGALRDGLGRRGELWYDDRGEPLETPRTDTGLRLNGTTGYAATSAPVLETRSGYTVGGWVRLAAKASDEIVVSQDGTLYSPFIIWYKQSSDAWCFGVKEKDESTGHAYSGVCSLQRARLNAWTHVAGSYDPVTNGVVLYVNGKRQGAATAQGAWASSGGLQIGRYKWANVYQYYFNGSIDEVAAWQQVLSDAQVATEARVLSSRTGLADVERVAGWDPGGATGTTLADTSPYGRNLTLSGGASLDGQAVVLDGSDDAAVATGPVVDDSGSFTVSTSVELDRDVLLSKDIGYVGQVAGQRTASGSSWGLWFELTGKESRIDDDGNEFKVPVGFWHFGRVGTDGAGDWVTSDEDADLGTPVRLTGVFDALDETAGSVVRLYVGLKQNDADKAFTSATGSGDFAVGKAYTASAWAHYLPCRIYDLRLWAGAMTGVDQIEATVGD